MQVIRATQNFRTENNLKKVQPFPLTVRKTEAQTADLPKVLGGVNKNAHNTFRYYMYVYMYMYTYLRLGNLTLFQVASSCLSDICSG